MEFTVLITKESDERWRASVREIPKCVAEAATRTEVLARIKERLTEASRYVEVVKVEVPDSSRMTTISSR